MVQSPLVQVVRLHPGAAAGEGVASCPGLTTVSITTQGDPSLGVAVSDGGKVGEGAETAAVDVQQLRRPAGNRVGDASSH